MAEYVPKEKKFPWALTVGFASTVGGLLLWNSIVPPNSHTASAHPGVDTMPGYNGEYIPTTPKAKNRFPEVSRRVAAHVCSVVVVERSTPLTPGEHRVIVNPILDTEVGTPATVSLDPSGITLSAGAQLDNYEVYNHQGSPTIRNRLDEAACDKEEVYMAQIENKSTHEAEYVVAGQYSDVHSGDNLALNARNAVRHQLTFETQMTNSQITDFLGSLK